MTDVRIPSYPKVWNLGHPAIADLFDGPVVVQEKYDGSQISWMWDSEGTLHVRSKGRVQEGSGEVPDGLFQGAVDYLLTVDPKNYFAGYIYRGEWFQKPKHNTLAYAERPKNGLVLYDVELSESTFMSPADVIFEADQLGISAARTFNLRLEHVKLTELEELLLEQSTLGGTLVEGVVIKNYFRWGKDGKVLMGKLVSEKFKEVHNRSWKDRHPNNADVVDTLIGALNTEARFEKAVQHLRDNGALTGTPADIGPLMVEIKSDVAEEERDWIIEKLADHFMPKIIRGVGRGLPEFYKAKLAELQFEQGTS